MDGGGIQVQVPLARLYCQGQDRRLASTNGIFVLPGCVGCNNPYDSGGCRHEGSPNRSPMLDPEVNKLAHDTLCCL